MPPSRAASLPPAGAPTLNVLKLKSAGASVRVCVSVLRSACVSVPASAARASAPAHACVLVCL
eukprot:3443349-Alexandrium_andersonii.AAC.1